MGFFDCVELLRKGDKTFSFLVMRKNLFGSFGFASVLFATALVGFDAQVALACSGGGSSGPGLSHGSSIGSRSVTVCVGSSAQSSGSSSTQTITKTVIVKVPVKKKPAPKKAPKVAAKPAPKKAPQVVAKPAPNPVSCPSSAQQASMPRSADAAERWVASVCSPPIKTKATPKPAPQVSAKPKQQFATRTITETITIDVPGSSYSSKDEADFYPNELKAAVAPLKVLGIGQSATFSSNGVAHYGISQILGRQAQVHFVPLRSGWSFSDGMTRSGADTRHSFQTAGKYQVQAWVKYQVSYRLLGETNWQPVAGQLTVDSNVLEVLVGALYLKGDEAGQGALLVGSDCLEKTKAFGCGI
jgi:hypothetical protein